MSHRSEATVHIAGYLPGILHVETEWFINNQQKTPGVSPWMNAKAKNASTVVVVIALVWASISAIVWGLLTYWNSQPEPSTYVIVSVDRNTGDINDCDDSYITTVDDVVTHQIHRMCGKLGEPSEIISVMDK